jgi:CNT family concentrative nucleoside transporter
MLIAAVAIIGLLDYMLGKVGVMLVATFFDSAKDVVVLNIDLNNLTLGGILGGVFRYAALVMGVPLQDATVVGGLMGTKMVINEFVAYSQMTPLIEGQLLDPKSIIIATFALCGFANFSSVAMLIGGLGELAPDRKHDLARLGLRAMFCGTLASYLSATIAGIIYTDPSSVGEQSLFTPLLIILVASLIIFAFNIANKHPERVPAIFARLSK